MPFLILKYQGKMIRQYTLESGRPLSIGRNEKNDIIIGNLAVSGFHARIEFDDNTVFVSDLESKNGTYVNGKRVERISLASGDELGVGKHQLLFSNHRADVSFHETPLTAQKVSSLDVTMAIDTSDLENGIQKGPIGVGVKPLPILVFKKGGKGRIELKTRYTRMGSARSNEVVVNGLFMGKRAATIVRRDDGFYINHVSGFLKPRLNGAKVGKEPAKLVHGDMISLGKSNLRFLSKVRMRRANEVPASSEG